MKTEQYFYRNVDKELLAWSNDSDRKVLLLRGARQVGKSSAVRHLGKSFKYFVEVNFENDDEDVKSLFRPGISPQEICKRLSFYYHTPVVAGETLLFLDEIQAWIPAISKLRYFYEQYPELHVIAAGSLLEFALEDLPSFGVGRIRSVFMYPFAFNEFLQATGDERLAREYQNASPSQPLPEIVHRMILKKLEIFMLFGGMPGVVAAYVKSQDFGKCQRALSDLLLSFRGDFAKYKSRVPTSRIGEVFESIAHQAEGKFIYERASEQASNRQVKDALELLIMAGLAYPVTHTTANGIPLGAGVNPKFRRMFLFDTGIFQRVLGLDVSRMLLSSDFKAINGGALAEIFVGLELLKASPCYYPLALYYWQREKHQSHAQVDFVLQRNGQIIPIEVKSGTSGKMQSLFLFLQEKKLEYGVRTSLENFAQYDKIRVYPLYAVSNLLLQPE